MSRPLRPHPKPASPQLSPADALKLITEIARLASQVEASDLPQLLTRVVEAVRAASGAGAIAYLLDHRSDEMYVAAQCGVPATAQGPLRLAVSDHPGSEDVSPSRWSPDDSGEPIQVSPSRILIPLTAGGRQLGLLHLQSPEGRLVLGEEELNLVTALASQAATAVERCVRQRETARLREWLDAFSSVLDASRTLHTAEEVKDLFEKIAQSAREISGADLVVLYEYFEERGDVRIPPARDGDFNRVDVLLEKGLVVAHKLSLIFRILERREPFYDETAPDEWVREGLIDLGAAHGDLSFFSREQVKSSAGVPLQIDAERVGVLFLNYRRKFTFSREFKEHFDLFAKQAALAIGNARFFLRSMQYSRKLESLNRIGRVLTSAATLDIARLGHLIEKQTKRIIDRPNFFLCLYNRAEDRLALEYIHDEFDRAEALMPGLQEGLAAYVCRTGRSLLADRETQERLFKEGKANLVGKQSKVWLGAPLKARGKVLGVLVVQDYEDESALTKEHEYLLTAVASQAAIAIDKYNLLRKEREQVEQLSALLELSRAFPSGRLPLRDLLSLILDHLCQLASCNGSLLVRSPHACEEECLAELAGDSVQLRLTELAQGKILAFSLPDPSAGNQAGGMVQEAGSTG